MNTLQSFGTGPLVDGLRESVTSPFGSDIQSSFSPQENPRDENIKTGRGTLGKETLEVRKSPEGLEHQGNAPGTYTEKQGENTGTFPPEKEDASIRGNRSRTGALRDSNVGPSTGEKLDSEAERADFEGVEAVDENHSGGNEGPNGFLREEVEGTSKELNVVEEAVQEAYGKYDVENGSQENSYRQVGRRIFCHVYHCQARFSKFSFIQGGVPITYKLIKEACRQADGVPVPTKTENVWAPLKQAGLLYVEEHRPGWSRRFLLKDRVLRRLSAALWKSCKYKSRYNLIDGSRYRGTERTRLTYDGEHSWDQRSGYIYETLCALRGQRDLVNRAAVTEYLESQMARCKRARDYYHHLRRQRAPRKKLHEARLELEKVRGRCDQDLRIWSEIVAQGLEETEDMPEGIFQYETAYEVQEASGRLTMKTGLQNASSEMKAAAAKGIPGYQNLDIASSQTEALILELEYAEKKGADVDLFVLNGYEGKDVLAERYGPDRNLWKRPEHAVKFGAQFNYDSFQAARSAAKGQVLSRIKDAAGKTRWDQLHTLAHETKAEAWSRAVYNKLSTMAQVAHDWAENEEIGYEDPEEVYELLRRVYGEMAGVLAEWRSWLVGQYWKECGKHGSKHGYFVENPCGLAMSIKADRLKDPQTGEVGRYEQEVALATALLQGREAAFMHALVQLAEEYDYEFLRNEHDGAVVVGEIPEAARQKACEMSGFRQARLEEKPYRRKTGMTSLDRQGDTKANIRTEGSRETRREERAAKHSQSNARNSHGYESQTEVGSRKADGRCKT